jgi:CMP-N-acetylneuraminic acid synthetase
MEMKPKITAVIPAKANSSRLPGKNILPFANSTLLEHKISQIQKVTLIDNIFLSSDSKIMLNMGKRMGIECLLRPKDLSDESRSVCDFFDYITNNVDCDIIVLLQCTSPMFSEKHIRECVEIFLEKVYGKNDYDSLISVYPFNHYLLNTDGPSNFEIGTKHKNSQELNDLYLLTCGIFIITKENMEKNHYHFGNNPYRYVVDQKTSIDIDTYEDYICAKSYFECY